MSGQDPFELLLRHFAGWLEASRSVADTEPVESADLQIVEDLLHLRDAHDELEPTYWPAASVTHLLLDRWQHAGAELPSTESASRALATYLRFLDSTGRLGERSAPLERLLAETTAAVAAGAGDGAGLRPADPRGAEIVRHATHVDDPDRAAEAFGSSRLLASLRALADWVGDGRPVTATGVLRRADAVQVIRLLDLHEFALEDAALRGAHEPVPPERMRSARDHLGLARLWRAAEVARILRVHGGRVIPDIGATELHDPTAQQLLVRGQLAVEGVLTELEVRDPSTHTHLLSVLRLTTETAQVRRDDVGPAYALIEHHLADTGLVDTDGPDGHRMRCTEAGRFFVATLPESTWRLVDPAPEAPSEVSLHVVTPAEPGDRADPLDRLRGLMATTELPSPPPAPALTAPMFAAAGLPMTVRRFADWLGLGRPAKMYGVLAAVPAREAVAEFDLDAWAERLRLGHRDPERADWDDPGAHAGLDRLWWAALEGEAVRLTFEGGHGLAVAGTDLPDLADPQDPRWHRLGVRCAAGALDWMTQFPGVGPDLVMHTLHTSYAESCRVVTWAELDEQLAANRAAYERRFLDPGPELVTAAGALHCIADTGMIEPAPAGVRLTLAGVAALAEWHGNSSSRSDC